MDLGFLQIALAVEARSVSVSIVGVGAERSPGAVVVNASLCATLERHATCWTGTLRRNFRQHEQTTITAQLLCDSC